MKGYVFIFVGIILIIVGVIVTQMSATVVINNRIADPETGNNAKLIVGAGLGLLGLFFAVVGVIQAIKGSKQKKRNQYILYNGVETQGLVTFVDKNYSVLVNKTPIYSIVEYTYEDKNGYQHKRRINNLSSELVIRSQIQVGSTVTVKYLAENPPESVMVLMS